MARDNRPAPPMNKKRVDELLKELDKQAPAAEWLLEFTRSLIENGDWPHAAHSALRGMPKATWLPLLNGDDRMMELVGELENQYGDLPDTTAWEEPSYNAWMRLAVLLLAKSWGFCADQPDPRVFPTHP